MKKKTAVVVSVFLMLIVCCKEKKGQGEIKVKKAETKVSMASTFTPCPYSAGKWLNGVNIEKKNQFFLSVAKNSPPPVRAGDRLKFAAAGEVLVKNVYRLDKDDQFLLFIGIDKELDPRKDGYPSPIYSVSRMIMPSAYSDGQKWKNGIQLANKRIFFFTLTKGDSLLLKSGDLLRFQKSGQAAVEHISRSAHKDGSLQFFVQVDRDLDPDADGYPQPVEMIARD